MSELLSRRAALAAITGTTAAFIFTGEAFAEEPKDKDKNGKNNQNGSTRSTSPVTPTPAEQPAQPEPRRVAPVVPVAPRESGVRPAAFGTESPIYNQGSMYQGKPTTTNYSGIFTVGGDKIYGFAGESLFAGEYTPIGELPLRDRGPVFVGSQQRPISTTAIAVHPIDNNVVAVLGHEYGNPSRTALALGTETSFTHLYHSNSDEANIPYSASFSTNGRYLLLNSLSRKDEIFRRVVYDTQNSRWIDIPATQSYIALLDTPPIEQPNDGSLVYYSAGNREVAPNYKNAFVPGEDEYLKVTVYPSLTRPRETVEVRKVSQVRGEARLLSSYVANGRNRLLFAGIDKTSARPTDSIWDVDPSGTTVKIPINPDLHGRRDDSQYIRINSIARNPRPERPGQTHGDIYAHVTNEARKGESAANVCTVEVIPVDGLNDLTKHYNFPERVPQGSLELLEDFQDRGFVQARLVNMNSPIQYRIVDSTNPNLKDDSDKSPMPWKTARAVKYY